MSRSLCLPSWPALVALAVMSGMLGFVTSQLVADPDTFTHVAAGKWMLEHAAVPAADPFSHSRAGVAWTAHEWLAQVIMAWIHRWSGWPGLTVMAVVALAGTLAYQARFLLRRLEPLHALVVTVISVSMLAPHLLARPHVLAWPLLAVWTGALVDSSERSRAPPWWLLLVIAIWANLHGGFTLGLALAVALAIEAVLQSPWPARATVAKAWGAFIGLSIVAAMATPHGWKGLWFTAQMMGPGLMREAIVEWRSPDFHRFQPTELWLLIVLALSLAGRLRLPWVRLLLVLGLVHLALAYGRNVELLGLVAPFLIATPAAQCWRGRRGSGQDVQFLDRLFATLAAPAKPLALLLVWIAGLAIVAAAIHFGHYAPPKERTPADAIAAARSLGATGNVLNDYSFGGYLIFQGVPVFVDGRADLYGRPFLERYFAAIRLKSAGSLKDLLKDYDIDWTLLRPDAPANALIDTMPCWRRIYADDVAIVHIRTCSSASG